MRNILLITISLLIFACSHKENETKKTEETYIEKSTTNSKNLNKSELTFEQTQDSLRNVLLNSKPNKALKSSILQEFYIKGLVTKVENKIKFNLPFNLHSLDCGAPDCYSTDVSFNIPFSEPVNFPKNIKVNLFEHGCIDKEMRKNETFTQVENSKEIINYYSEKLKSNLIIKIDGSLYYYPHQKNKSFSSETVDKMFENNEFEELEIVPFQSTLTRANEYEQFIKSN